MEKKTSESLLKAINKYNKDSINFARFRLCICRFKVIYVRL